MLGVRLGEHHQFDIRRRALQFRVTLTQVGDFVLGQGQAETRVGGLQLVQRDALQRHLRGQLEQGRRRFAGAQQ